MGLLKRPSTLNCLRSRHSKAGKYRQLRVDWRKRVNHNGVTIGDNAIIGAGSVVTHDIRANAIAVGNPSRVIKYVNNND